MSMWIIPPVAGFIDQGMAPEIHIDGIGGIELINGNLRAYMFSEQLPLDGQTPHRIVTAKLIGPALILPTIIGQLAQCLWKPSQEQPPLRGQAPHLVP